ncbi:MAG: tetratricopeptide repeat protein [Candidatus Aureabacteria bacterium]|nr:tetratricopeptide repeat protein [Candidatus Auribacterota bacterium]
MVVHPLLIGIMLATRVAMSALPLIHFDPLRTEESHRQPSCTLPLISFTGLRLHDAALAPVGEKRRVAILGFHSAGSRRPAHAWLGRELADTLAERLKRAPLVEVITSEELRRFQARSGGGNKVEISSANVSALSRSIGADILLLGSYRVSKGALQIELRAFRPVRGGEGSAIRVDGSADRIWEAEDRLAARCAALLGQRVGDEAAGRLFSHPTESPVAFEELCKGRQAPEGTHRKIRHLQKAIEADPSCAEAHYLLGGAYCGIGTAYQYVEWYNMALEEYRKAAAIDPGCAKAYCGLGLIYMMNSRYDLSRKSLERALELEPGMVTAKNYLNQLGRMGH